MAVPVNVPVTTTAWPTAMLVVAVQENCPAVPVTATPASKALGVDADAFALNMAVHTPETSCALITVVPEGMPVPVTDTPAPMPTLTFGKVIVDDPEVVVAVSVNTPTGRNVVPVNGPNSGRVFTDDEMSAKFWPG